MSRIVAAFVFVCRCGTLVAFLVLAYAVVAQILGRTVLPYAPAFTEELTRFALLWMVACAAGLSLRSGDLVSVDILTAALPRRARRVLLLVSCAIIVGLCGALLQPSLFFASIGARQTSSAMGWPMTWFNASILVLLATLMIFAVFRALAILAGREEESAAPDDTATGGA